MLEHVVHPRTTKWCLFSVSNPNGKSDFFPPDASLHLKKPDGGIAVLCSTEQHERTEYQRVLSLEQGLKLLQCR